MSSDFKVTLKIVLHTHIVMGWALVLKDAQVHRGLYDAVVALILNISQKTAFVAVVASATNLFVFAYE